MLVLSLAAMALAAAVLVGGTLWRALARRDHRCAVVSRPRACDACTAVLEGSGTGGHVVCACGAASPHLAGPDLLRWQADHQGEAWPEPPPEGAARVPDAADDEVPLLEELDEAGLAERRRVAQARRRPDPRTPELLREAAAEHRDVNQS